MAAPPPKPAPAWSDKYDAALTETVINSQHILQVSFLTKDSEFPSVCYLVGKILKVGDNPKALYVHGHIQEPVNGRLVVAREEGDPGLSVSITANSTYSYYAGLSGVATGFTFACTVLNGTASLMDVSDKKQREDVMSQIVNAQIPNRWDNIAPMGNDLNYVSLVKITINEKKSHTHSRLNVLGYERKNDIGKTIDKKELWEGAIPVWEQLGEPVSGPHNPGGSGGEAPAYVTKFIDDENKNNKEYAVKIAKVLYPYDLDH